MGILSAVFGTAKNTDKIVDGAVKGIDKLVFTNEEKAEYQAKAADWFLRYLEASQPQNVSRRLIAVVVSAVWAFYSVLTAIVGLLELYLGGGTTVGAEFLAGTGIKLVLPSFGLIVSFYFIKHMISAAKT